MCPEACLPLPLWHPGLVALAGQTQSVSSVDWHSAPQSEVALGLLLPLSSNDGGRSIPRTIQVQNCILLRRSRPPFTDDNIADFAPTNFCLELHRSLFENRILRRRPGCNAAGVLTVANLAQPTECILSRREHITTDSLARGPFASLVRGPFAILASSCKVLVTSSRLITASLPRVAAETPGGLVFGA